MTWRANVRAVFGCAEDGEEMASLVVQEDNDGRLRIEIWDADGELGNTRLLWIAAEDRAALAFLVAGPQPSIESAVVLAVTGALQRQESDDTTGGDRG